MTAPEPLPVLAAMPLSTPDYLPQYLLLMVGRGGRLESGYAGDYVVCPGAGCPTAGCTRAWRPAARPAPPACARCGQTTEPLEPLSDDDPDNWDLICFDWNACEARLVQQEAAR